MCTTLPSLILWCLTMLAKFQNVVGVFLWLTILPICWTVVLLKGSCTIHVERFLRSINSEAFFFSPTIYLDFYVTNAIIGYFIKNCMFQKFLWVKCLDTLLRIEVVHDVRLKFLVIIECLNLWSLKISSYLFTLGLI